MEVRIARQGIYGTAYPATTLVTWHFRDFELRYLGAKNIQILHFTVSDYQSVAKTQQGEVPISWNSGLGDIAPRPFKIDGRTYFLEMEFSELLGQRIKGKFVVYPDNDPALAVRWPHYALAHLVPLQSVLSLQTPGIGGIRLADQPHEDLSIGRLESGKSSCDRRLGPGGRAVPDSTKLRTKAVSLA